MQKNKVMDSVSAQKKSEVEAINNRLRLEGARCACCKKSVHELKPFEDPEDFFFDSYNGYLLAKQYRPFYVLNEEESKFIEENREIFFECDEEEAIKLLKKKCGEKVDEKLWLKGMAANSVGSSRECRDCFALDHREYIEKMYDIRL
jgi:hypothetical protein